MRVFMAQVGQWLGQLSLWMWRDEHVGQDTAEA